MNPDMFQNTESKFSSRISSTTIPGNEQKTPNPTLGTIKMVEEALSTMSEYPTKNKLWRSLPRQVQYPIFKEILKYLEESNKLILDKDGMIVWIFADNPKLKELKRTSKSLLNQ